MGGLPSRKFQFNHPHEPHQAAASLAWLVDALLCFCLLKLQLDTTCTGDPEVLRLTLHTAPQLQHRPRPHTATFLTRSRTDAMNVLIHCSSVQHESTWFPKCSRVCSGLWFWFFSPSIPLNLQGFA